MRKNILLVPRTVNPGGVANYYAIVCKWLDKKHFVFIERGHDNKKSTLFRLISDYCIFIKILIVKRPLSITFNTSLGRVGIIRDGFYHILVSKFTKRIVFYRGWNTDFEKKLDTSSFYRWWFRITFLKADHSIVLASSFRDKLIEWGYKKSITIETTLVDENQINEFNINNIFSDCINILFLSRIEKAKGIFEAVEAVSSITNKNIDIQFNIAGDGSAMEDLAALLRQNHVENIYLKGYLTGESKTEIYSLANIFIFPSAHGEGMPNSILEAMAFGLPVITTRVGGIPDFFEDGKMGLFLDNREPEHIAEKIEYLIERPELMKEISEYNYNYAKEHFYASKVAKRLEKIISDVVEERI